MDLQAHAPEVTEEELLEITGEEQLGDVHEVALREKGLAQVPSILLAATNLEVLSLSHNRIQSLEKFGCFKALQYANLNFNALTSLNGIEQCKELRQLFIANNRVRELEPLASCQHLEVLSLYQNNVTSLDAALFVFRGLPGLKKLDFDGNPCASNLKAYRNQLLYHLPHLAELDGDEVSNLDRELAWEYAQTEEMQPVFDPRASHKMKLKPAVPPVQISQISEDGPGSLHMPLPSPGWGGETPRGWQAQSPEKKPARPFTAPAGAAAQLSASFAADDRMFGCDFLNDHPIVLEYLAGSEFPMDDEGGPVRPVGGTQAAPNSFANRLRATTATMNAATSLSVNELAQMEMAGAPQGYQIEEAVLHMPSDNPQQMVRRLLRVCEMLRRQRDAAVEGERRTMAALDELAERQGGGSCAESTESVRSSQGGEGGLGAARPGTADFKAKVPMTTREAEELAKTAEMLVRENRQLRAENKNMYHLHEENKGLRADVQQLQFRIGELKKLNDGMREAKASSLSSRSRAQSNPRLVPLDTSLGGENYENYGNSQVYKHEPQHEANTRGLAENVPPAVEELGQRKTIAVSLKQHSARSSRKDPTQGTAALKPAGDDRAAGKLKGSKPKPNAPSTTKPFTSIPRRAPSGTVLTG